MRNYFNYYSFIFAGRVILDVNPWERTKLGIFLMASLEISASLKQ